MSLLALESRGLLHPNAEVSSTSSEVLNQSSKNVSNGVCFVLLLWVEIGENEDWRSISSLKPARSILSSLYQGIIQEKDKKFIREILQSVLKAMSTSKIWQKPELCSAPYLVSVQELTEEGLPFLILFHMKDDTESLEKFQQEVARQLISEKGRR